MTKNDFECRMCGKCCHYEIPLTILDIHRIAKELDIQDKKAFSKIIQGKPSKKSNLFKIRKKEDRSCIFLNEENKCDIHEARPNVCEFYFCDLSEKDEMISWTSKYILTEDKAKLWEQSIAIQITNVYIKKHGANFKENDYEKALKSIKNNIKTSSEEKIKLGNIPGGNPCGIIYDCTKCDYERGKMAEETIITLSDVKRIKESMNISYEKFFNKYISKDITADGYLMLRRNKNCIFFDEENHCSIEDTRPMHCRFTPCPVKVDKNLKSCLYLGSGTVDEQFEHQISLSITKDYVMDIGPAYDNKTLEKYLEKINNLIKDDSQLMEFCEKISPYRYVDDTKSITG
ncbi:MAG: YkgJ family cysteine cluster protein [Thermoplasmatota archaeon]